MGWSSDVGDSVSTTGSGAVIWRLTPSGDLDSEFGGGAGYVTHQGAAGGTSGDVATAVILDSLRNYVMTGWGQNSSGDLDMVLWRYLPAGTLDTTFAGTGIVSHTSTAGYDRGYELQIDHNQRIVVVGWSTSSSSSDATIWRYTSSGALDTSFDSDGIAVFDDLAGGEDYDLARDLVIDAQNRIIITGYSSNGSDADMVLFRLQYDGSLDTSFGTDGFVVSDNSAGGNGSDAADSVFLDGQGNILVVGSSEKVGGGYNMVVWNYTDDGSPRECFGTNGVSVQATNAPSGQPYYRYVGKSDAKARIVVAGYFFETDADMAIWKLE